MIKKSHGDTAVSNTFLSEWMWNALGYTLMVGLVIGIGAFLLPFICYGLSGCFGVGAEAIGWIMTVALTLTGAAVGAVVGHYIGKRQQEILERNLSIKVNWKSATQYGLTIGFAVAGLLLQSVTDMLPPVPDEITSSVLIFVAMFPLITFVLGISQCVALHDVVDDTSQWLGVQLLSSLVVSTILVASTTNDIQLRLLSAMLMLICIGVLKAIISDGWYDIVMNLAGIALMSSMLMLFADELLLFGGVKVDTVDNIFVLLYVMFFAGTLSIFKAHTVAVALLDMLAVKTEYNSPILTDE